jgi:hypothetical protein
MNKKSETPRTYKNALDCDMAILKKKQCTLMMYVKYFSVK